MFQKKLKMKKCRKTISEIYPFEWIVDDDNATIFGVLCDSDTYPLVAGFITSDNYQELNSDYYIGNSADKFISPLHQKMLDQISDDVTKNQVIEFLTKVVYNRFAQKWKNIYDALMTEYNPLENYSMEEVRTPDLTTDETQNEKTDITTERETSASNSYKGFNATDPVLVNQTDGDETTTTSGAKADNEVTKKIEQTGTETLTRAGNIGVTTSQQMLESEFKVRQYDFYKMVYNDIDSILCLSIY